MAEKKQVLRITAGIPRTDEGHMFQIRFGLEPPNPSPGGKHHPKLALLREFLEDPSESKRRNFIETFPEERNSILMLEGMLVCCVGECLDRKLSTLKVTMPNGEEFTLVLSFEL